MIKLETVVRHRVICGDHGEKKIKFFFIIVNNGFVNTKYVNTKNKYVIVLKKSL